MDDPLAAAKSVLLRFDPEERRELYRFLALRLGRKPKLTAQVARIEKPTGNAVTFREERVKCGDKSCHCAKGGALHGPYWYRYERKDGKLCKRYVGKKRPTEAPTRPS